ncbi:MAG: Hsp33 family molecular chaperone HslO [Lachnospiraceae bacterium]|nr:Hsp33 family molecular chaperone HslO [Lachnospiraceae bacterium]
MSDYLIRATAAGAQIRAFAAVTTETAERARTIHNTCPTMTAALGRLLTAGAMMGSMMKGDDDLLTLQIRGEGPGKGLTVTATANGTVKGYPVVPVVNLPANAKGKLDVGGALYPGTLSVIRDMGLKEPYVGQTVLQTGEIAEDLTYYFAASEQTPSSVALGVLMNSDNTVRHAGGFILQLMPFAEDSMIDRLEANLKDLPSVTKMMEEGLDPEGILRRALAGFDVEITDTMPVEYSCNCSREKMEKALIAIGQKDLRELIEENEPVTMNCQFCGSSFTFSIEELKKMAGSHK